MIVVQLIAAREPLRNPYATLRKPARHICEILVRAARFLCCLLKPARRVCEILVLTARRLAQGCVGVA